MKFIISEETLNKILNLLEDKPFKTVISILNEIKASPLNEKEGIDFESEEIKEETILN